MTVKESVPIHPLHSTKGSKHACNARGSKLVVEDMGVKRKLDLDRVFYVDCELAGRPGNLDVPFLQGYLIDGCQVHDIAPQHFIRHGFGRGAPHFLFYPGLKVAGMFDNRYDLIGYVSEDDQKSQTEEAP